MSITAHLKQPTRKPVRATPDPKVCFPIWSCTGWGLPSHCPLPVVRWALTPPFHPYPADSHRQGGLFSVALSVGSHRPVINWHPALWCPDFPPRVSSPRLPNSLARRHNISKPLKCPAKLTGFSKTNASKTEPATIYETSGISRLKISRLRENQQLNQFPQPLV